MNTLHHCSSGLALWTALACGATHAENWPQWRGPQGTGVSHETGLPVEWSKESGLAWKIDLPEWGTSTPAIWGNTILVTTQSEEKLLLLWIDKATGQIRMTREVGTAETRRESEKRTVQKFHRLHNNASPSPVTDGKTVVVHFGNGLLAAYDVASSEPLWNRDLQAEHGAYTIWWGHANSPVIVGDTLVSVCMQDSLAGINERKAPSYLTAHDLRTGAERWHTDRSTVADAEECDSYTTPLLRTVGGQTELVVMGGNQLDAYAPESGRQLWRLEGLQGGRTITGPTLAGDRVLATRGMRGELVSMRPTEGDLSEAAIAWRHGENTPDTCWPVVANRFVFIVSDDGIAQCLDAQTGEQKWKKRLGGNFKASPIAAENRVYFLDTSGKATVVAAEPEFSVLAENQLDDETLASIAVSDGRLYIRGRAHLYAIGSK